MQRINRQLNLKFQSFKMFLSTKLICFKLIILLSLITYILGDCYIEFPQTSDVKPRLYKYVGTHKIKVNTDGAGSLKLHEQQEMEAYCDSNFEMPSNFNKENQLFVKCSQSYITLSPTPNQKKIYNRVNRPFFKCSVDKWNLYETDVNLNWCPSNMTSYMVARSELWNPITSPFNKLAGICYDTYNLSLQSIYYTLAPNGTKDVQPTLLKDFYTTTAKIDHILVKETFGSKSVLRNTLGEGQPDKWLTISQYQFNSMIQHTKFDNAFSDQFPSLLEFVWWPNLRLYNWRRYIQALEDHVENDYQAYDILAGVSGTIQVPISRSCQENYTMRKVLLETERKIPLYVWNYLQDRSNRSNELVVIGLNSPFFEFYPTEDIIFCPDKCHQIPWLKKAISSFRYNIMGIVFCCSVDDVQTSKRLDGFPEKGLRAVQLELFNAKNFPSTEKGVQQNETVSTPKNGILIYQNVESSEDMFSFP